jgi:hypothetical protein
MYFDDIILRYRIQFTIELKGFRIQAADMFQAAAVVPPTGQSQDVTGS